MVQHTKYIQTSVTEYIAYDGKVFTDESKCREYERRGADPNPSVRFFNGIVELIPSSSTPIKRLLELATVYVIIDPKRAARFLHGLNEAFGTGFATDGLSAGAVYIYNQNERISQLFDDRISGLVNLYNAVMTACEASLGSSAMEVFVNWRARA